MLRRLGTALVLALGAASAVADDIYRHRTADGRTIFSDSPVSRDAVESTRLSPIGARLVALAPGLDPGDPAARDRAQAEVRTAEAELMRAYNRLTADVLPRRDELMELPAADPAPPARGRTIKLPKTPQYYERIGALKADIDRAQERVDRARARYYALN